MWFPAAIFVTVLWAMGNVLDSIVINRFEKSPIVVMWFASAMRLPLLFLAACFIPLSTPYYGILLLAGALLYIITILYFFILKHIDASITQSAWAIESIILTFLGFFVLQESWTAMQTMGALLILSAVFLLSYWHKHISFFHTVGILLLLALAGAPFQFTVKIILDKGTLLSTTVLWYLLGRDIFAFLWPFFHRSQLQLVKKRARGLSSSFLLNVSAGMVLSILSFATESYAYGNGPLSLVSIVENIQPFVVIGISAIVMKMGIVSVPKELLTKQSIQIKSICFSLILIGLLLLA